MRSLVVLLLVRAAAACNPYGATESSSPTVADAGSADAHANEAGIGTDGGAPLVDAGTCPREFDEKFDFLPGWSKTVEPGAQIEASGGKLVATVTPTSTSSQAQLRVELPTGGAHTARLAFTMRVLEHDDGEIIFGCSLGIHSDEHTGLMIGSYAKGGVLNVDDSAEQNDTTLPTSPGVVIGALDPMKTYAVVSEARAITESSAHVTISVDGTKALDRVVTLPGKPALFVVKCGIDYADDGTAAKVEVDDATLDLCR